MSVFVGLLPDNRMLKMTPLSKKLGLLYLDGLMTQPKPHVIQLKMTRCAGDVLTWNSVHEPPRKKKQCCGFQNRAVQPQKTTRSMKFHI